MNVAWIDLERHPSARSASKRAHGQFQPCSEGGPSANMKNCISAVTIGVMTTVMFFVVALIFQPTEEMVQEGRAVMPTITGAGVFGLTCGASAVLAFWVGTAVERKQMES